MTDTKVVKLVTAQDREKKELAAAMADKYCDETGGAPKPKPKPKKAAPKPPKPKPPAPEPDEDDDADEGAGAGGTTTDALIEIAREANLFHTPDGTGFADINVRSVRQTWPIKSKGFRDWLVYRFYERTERAPNSDAIKNALATIGAKCVFEGDERKISLRAASHGDKIYIDLADKEWRCIEIDASGWQIIDRPRARFRRASGMLPLCEPVRGGSVALLKQFLNVQHKDQFTLTVAWLMAALRGSGPYPVLGITGEQGSAKSTTTRMLRELIDPNKSPIRSMPRESDDLFIAANNGYVIAFDNVSGLPLWLSDDLCKLVTGGGYSKRQLYTDQDEIIFEAMRPIILNGIEDMVGRPDLQDRTMFVGLEHIDKSKRKTEKALWAEFNKVAPAILGALLDAVVVGLKREPHIVFDDPPRMADFATWMVACEAALWEPGTFMAAYTINADEACATLVDGDIVATAVMEFMSKKQDWLGDAKHLLGELDVHVGEAGVRRKEWPKSPKVLANALRRLAPPLRKQGLEVKFFDHRVGEYRRPLKLEWVDQSE